MKLPRQRVVPFKYKIPATEAIFIVRIIKVGKLVYMYVDIL